MSTTPEKIDLFTPVQIGPYTLPNRIVIAPFDAHARGGRIFCNFGMWGAYRIPCFSGLYGLSIS